MVESLRNELEDKELKIKVSDRAGNHQLEDFSSLGQPISDLFYLIVQRLRQEKLGLLLKCFTELSAVLHLLGGPNSQQGHDLLNRVVEDMSMDLNQLNTA